MNGRTTDMMQHPALDTFLDLIFSMLVVKAPVLHTRACHGLCAEGQSCNMSLSHNESWPSLILTSLSRFVAARELNVVGDFHKISSGVVDSSEVAVGLTETSACGADGHDPP